MGTSLGRLATFKILPAAHGTFTASFAGVTALDDDRIILIHPMDAQTGQSAYASQSAMANLRNGLKIDGVLIVVTLSGVRILHPSASPTSSLSSKGAHKSFDPTLCDAASIAQFQDRGHCLLGLFGDGFARAYSIPALKELGSVRVNETIDIRRFADAMISPDGDILGWIGPSEMSVLNVWGTGRKYSSSGDRLWNPETLAPPRPTISNLQWIAGTQYITPSDMDVLIGGSDRPPSKRMIEEMRSQEHAQRMAGRPGPGGTQQGGGPRGPAASQEEEGYWAYMQRQVQERTERLGIMGDNMDNLAEESGGWADDVSKFVAKQKRQAVLGGEFAPSLSFHFSVFLFSGF